MIKIKKGFRFLLVFVLILEMVGGVVYPFKLSTKSPYVSSQKALAAGEGWYATGGTWLYRKQIAIDHTKVADVATPSATYANFPVLISLDALSNIQANGTDIRFTSGDGTTELPREIESYSSGSLKAWVKTTLTKDSSDATDDIIYMYYGNSSATTEPAANSTYGSQNVWKTDGVDTSNVMTQHMKDSLDTSHIADSTSNANNGTKIAANEPIQADAQIAKGQTFDGVNDYVNAGNGASLNLLRNFTISAWIKNGSTLTQTIAAKSSAYSSNRQYYFFVVGNELQLWLGGTFVGAKSLNADNKWHYVGVTVPIGNSGVIFYVDGVGTLNSTTYGTGTTTNDVLIGATRAYGNNNATDYFNGSIDDVRIYNRALSAQEITTQYNNTNSPSTFYSLGIEEKQSPTALTSWGYRKAITIDHTKVAAAQTNFPILINLPTDASLASHAKSDGSDILFATSSASWATATENDKFAHEIEKYTTATGELQAWVRIPTLSSTVDTVIYLYYGNAAATGQRNKTVVWDGSTKMVQHLAETSGNHIDSTANANTGTPHNGVVQGTTGQIDGADTFDGVNDYVDAGNGASLNITGDITLEAWTYTSNTASTKGIIGTRNGGNDYSGPYNLRIVSNASFWMGGGSPNQNVLTSPSNLNINTWNHIVGTITGTSMRLYVNGGLVNTMTFLGTRQTVLGKVTIGSEDFNLRFFSGSIDEVRVYNRALSAQEITTQYNNQFSPSTFVKTLGSEEPKISATAPTATQATDGTGYVSISTTIDDSTDANTARFKVEYSLDGGTTWTSGDPYLTSFVTTSPSQATQPDVTNSQTYQVGMPTNNIVTSAGANTVTVKWDTQSASNGLGAITSQSNVKLRITPNDGTSDGAPVVSAASFAIDNTAPTGGSIGYTDGYYTSTSVALTAGDGTDSGSGINNSSRTIQRKSATLSSGTCGSYGSFATITPTGTYPSFTDATVASGNCYQYRYLVADNTGNQATYTGGNTVKVDTSLPSTPASPSTTTPTNSSSQTWSWSAATDALSGVANYAWRVTTSLGAAVTSGTTSSLSVVTNLAEGAYNFFVKAIDNAGNNGAESSGAVMVDKTAPVIPGTPSTLTPTNNIIPQWSFTASTDSGSGLATNAYTLQWSKDAAFSSGVYSSTSTTNSFTHTNPLTNGTWYMRVKATDIAGNDSNYSGSGSVIVNTSAPAGSVSINSGDTYTNTTGVTLTISASDNVDSASSLQMEIANTSDFSGAAYESFMTSKAWTLPTTDGEKTVYVRIKDTSGNVGTYSDTITLDTTAPNSFDLDSPPGNDSYTNNERPSFRWKATTIGDATSGLSKYKLEVDNGDTGDFTIDGIPTSRTTDYETSKYTVHYDGFSDTDSSNNYISVYTKHSVDWGASENDGKLKAGKRTWKVVAYDNAGNSRDASRTLYADYTNPSLSNTAILESDILGTKDGYTVVSNLRPTFTGDISDNYSPGKVEVSFFKQNFFLGIETGRTLFLKESFDLKNTTDKTSLSFSLYPSQDIDYGKYRVDVTGIDKAGNSSATDSFNLWVLSGTQAKLILTQGKTKEETKKITEVVNNQAQVSLPELEKKAILRREKEASEFSKLTQGFGDSINVVANGVKQSLSQLASNFYSIFNETSSNVKNMAGSLSHAIASAFNAIGSGAKNIYLAISNTGKTISSGIDTAISNTGKALIAWTGNAGNAYRRTAKATPGIIGDAMTAVGDTAGDFAAFNYKLGSDFVKEQEKIQKQIGKTQKETGENLKTSAQNTQLFFGAISDGISGVNKKLDKSQESVKKQIAKANKDTNDTISGIGVKAKDGFVNIAFDVGKRTQDVSDTVGLAIIEFTYNFVSEPTRIYNVQVASLSDQRQCYWSSIEKYCKMVTHDNNRTSYPPTYLS